MNRAVYALDWTKDDKVAFTGGDGVVRMFQIEKDVPSEFDIEIKTVQEDDDLFD